MILSLNEIALILGYIIYSLKEHISYELFNINIEPSSVGLEWKDQICLAFRNKHYYSFLINLGPFLEFFIKEKFKQEEIWGNKGISYKNTCWSLEEFEVELNNSKIKDELKNMLTSTENLIGYFYGYFYRLSKELDNQKAESYNNSVKRIRKIIKKDTEFFKDLEQTIKNDEFLKDFCNTYGIYPKHEILKNWKKIRDLRNSICHGNWDNNLKEDQETLAFEYGEILLYLISFFNEAYRIP